MTIELRWLREPVTAEGHIFPPKLQWRQEAAGGGGGTFGNAPPDHVWQDVPQVIAGAPIKESQEVWNAAERIATLEAENAKLKKALAEIRAIGEK